MGGTILSIDVSRVFIDIIYLFNLVRVQIFILDSEGNLLVYAFIFLPIVNLM